MNDFPQIPQQPQPQPQWPTMPMPAPRRPDPSAPQHRSKPRAAWVVGAVTTIAALLAGVGIGASSNSTTAEPVAAAGTTEVVPQSCLDALDAAERLVHRGVVPAFDIVVDVLDAVSVFDVGGIEAATADLDRLTGRTERLVADYNASADQCRSHA